MPDLITRVPAATLGDFKVHRMGVDSLLLHWKVFKVQKMGIKAWASV